MRRHAARFAVLAVFLGACDESEGPPADPPGTIVTRMSPGDSLDFETGAVMPLAGGDLIYDTTGNLRTLDRFASVGTVRGLADMTTYPASGWVASMALARGLALVVKSDASYAYTVYVADGAPGEVITVKWRRMDGVFRLMVSPTGGGYGRVTSEPAGIDCPPRGGVPWDCAEPFVDGTNVVLTARAEETNFGFDDCPAAPSEFGGWGGRCAGTGTCAVSMDEDSIVEPAFAHLVLLFLSTSGPGMLVHDLGEPTACVGTVCHWNVRAGTPVTLTATPDSGNRFLNWRRDADGQCGFTASGEPQVTISSYVCALETTDTCTFTAGESFASCASPGCLGWVGYETAWASFGP